MVDLNEDNPTQISALATVLEAAGMKAKVWKGQRVYVNGLGRDISAYIVMDDPDAREWTSLMQGATLKVFTNAEQSRVWQINRCKQVKHQLMWSLHEAGVTGDMGKPCENWQDVIL